MVNTRDVWTLILILIVVFVIPSLILLAISSGPNFWKITGYLLQSGLLLIIPMLFSGGFLILGVIIAYSYPKVGKIMAYIGVGGVLLTLIFIEAGVASIIILTNTGVALDENFLENFKKASLNYPGTFINSCDKLPVPKGGVVSLIDSLSCIVTGYLPTSSSPALYIGFWIFGVVMPLLVTSGIFNDMVESSGIITNRISKRLIGWGLGFMAYRGLLISGLVYILDFASAGMAVLTLNFIFVGGLLGYTNNIFKKWQPLEDAMEFGKSMKVGSINAREVLKQAISLANQGNVQGAGNLLTPFQQSFMQADPSGRLWNDVSIAIGFATQGNQQALVKKLRTILRRYF